MNLKGKKVNLVPMRSEDKEEFFRLATESEGSKFWYGEEKRKTKTKEEFFKDWKEGYFDFSLAEQGQCFWIVVKGEKIGQVNHNKIDKENRTVELDIIIGPKDKMGQGYGPDALETLIHYLFNNFNINKVWIGARANNPRAVKAYQKVGFKKEGLLRQQDFFEGEFVDVVRFGLLREEFSG